MPLTMTNEPLRTGIYILAEFTTFVWKLATFIPDSLGLQLYCAIIERNRCRLFSINRQPSQHTLRSLRSSRSPSLGQPCTSSSGPEPHRSWTLAGLCSVSLKGPNLLVGKHMVGPRVRISTSAAPAIGLWAPVQPEI